MTVEDIVGNVATTVFLLGFCLRLHLKQKTVHWRPQLEKKNKKELKHQENLLLQPTHGS